MQYRARGMQYTIEESFSWM